MPKTEVTHFNPKETRSLTRCGLLLLRVKRWTEDSKDATCNNCTKLIRMDARQD